MGIPTSVGEFFIFIMQVEARKFKRPYMEAMKVKSYLCSSIQNAHVLNAVLIVIL
jgi:hypothetical protein